MPWTQHRIRKRRTLESPCRRSPPKTTPHKPSRHRNAAISTENLWREKNFWAGRGEAT
ncbi:uncharacterized protein K452DRAFT_285094 [Aplosporella prunicola CBS 121167]|uniref:Uncharacterized protein n=1 Tax=Aplosporella prunicola CBS 121167 TaxID=1176127 RepID=A0A6A6BKX8_9PEZI|nr:uncharacterized protein K452DRAFT_285094 [Aplosporella prunicola CBS 121167]KAF2144759.1 hypothetical protein K452DRAFT_285094 [Aplosporella prunicola CBS 121167]